jgi:hypothetical protein
MLIPFCMPLLKIHDTPLVVSPSPKSQYGGSPFSAIRYFIQSTRKKFVSSTLVL